MPKREIKRALISVYDKTGIVEFAKALSTEFGIEIISTGGTAKLLKENDIPVTLVEEVTGFPEMMDGRVKTLHPKIHAGILADRDNPEHMRQLEEQGIKPIDMVVVNLYPFEKTVADPTCTLEQAIEMIDIGGPCMLRAAAKNHKHVLVVSGGVSFRYNDVLHFMAHPNEGFSLEHIRRSNALSSFLETAKYDAAVVEWLSRDEGTQVPAFRPFFLFGPDELRYGENPHQLAEHRTFDLFSDRAVSEADIAYAVDENEVSLSFNNYADGHAALELCKELTRELCRTDMCGTGILPVSNDCVAPASSRWRPIEGDRQSERNLPHLETAGRSYFVTFRTITDKILTPKARDEVLSASKYWHGKKMTLHAVVVMPDHAHLLLTPFETETGGNVPLGELIHSIKRYSANVVNKLEGNTGPLWQDERWDRIVRHRKEFTETWEYIETNPDRAGLGSNYEWFWSSQTNFEESGLVHRQDAGATLCCVFIKHTNACGSSVGADRVEAYRRAYLGDPNAAMGGILACNFEIDQNFAITVMETYDRFGKEAGAGGFFIEVWIAPSFDEDVIEIIRKAKKWGRRVRLLGVGDMDITPDERELEYKSITGGMLVQTRDMVGLNEDQWKVVTKRTPTDQELNDLRLAWLVCKHTKSNAISLCRDNMLIGNGAGQMSRVMSCRIATWLAKENGHEEKLSGSVAASDAFFPFRDGPDILMEAGVSAIIQPGGSKRDADTIKACDENGVSMIHTGTRHFKH